MFRTYTPIFRSNECYNSFTYAAYRVLGVVRCRSWGVCVLVACCSATVEFRGWGFEHPNPPLGTPLVQPSLSTLSSDAQSLFLPQPDTCAPHNTTQHNTTQHSTFLFLQAWWWASKDIPKRRIFPTTRRRVVIQKKLHQHKTFQRSQKQSKES